MHTRDDLLIYCECLEERGSQKRTIKARPTMMVMTMLLEDNDGKGKELADPATMGMMADAGS